jgi:2,3,4,5-tetrahydropyridine-2-carboxylate N-succinyltransferase
VYDIKIQETIISAWERRNELNFTDSQNPEIVTLRTHISQAMESLDSGQARVAEKVEGQWRVNQWLKQALLLSFRLNDNRLMAFGENLCYDKVPLKFEGWNEQNFKAAGIRAVPGAIVRKSAYVAPNVIIMPSFINVGAYVGSGTMVDSWVTVGSCAQIGANCHISSGVTIGGVLEPLQANPTIIEGNVFVGTGSEVVEGVVIEEGAVIGMGVSLSSSTKIYNRSTGEITYGRIPAYSVVVPGTIPAQSGGYQVAAAIIIKTVDSNTKAKTSINELLRGI